MTTGPLSLPDRFEAAEEVASTPFERTLRAYDRVLQRQILLKLPGEETWAGWSVPVRERLLREARLLAKVRHEAIAPIHWVEETAEGPLLVLDLPEGEALRDRLGDGPLGADEVRELGIQLAEALGAVHYHGIVHRAISADSVRLLADDRVRLGAFTFAKAFGGRQTSIDYKRARDSAVAPFLPPYLAPEQTDESTADARTDVFALGCLLYRCLAGQDPFPDGAGSAPPPDLRSLRPEVPKDLWNVLRRCLLAVPTARYPSAAAVAMALQQTRPVAKQRIFGTNRRTLLTAGVGALALGGLGFWLTGGGEVRPPPPPWTPRPGDFESTYDKCHALLIGIAKAYEGSGHPALMNPVNEVTAVRDRLLLNDPGHWKDNIELLTEADATKQMITEKLTQLQSKPGRNDAVLLYYSGHGKEDGFQYYLVPTGAPAESDDFDRDYLGQGLLANFLDRCRAKHVLVVLDCCYSGRLFDQMKGRSSEGAQGTAKQSDQLLRHPARQFLGSTREQAADGSGGMSPFCSAFLKALTPMSQGGPYADSVRAITLHGYVTGQMAKATAAGEAQDPVLRAFESARGAGFDRIDPRLGSFVFFLPK